MQTNKKNIPIFKNFWKNLGFREILANKNLATLLYLLKIHKLDFNIDNIINLIHIWKKNRKWYQENTQLKTYHVYNLK